MIDEENGLSHFQSLNHFASPLVLFLWMGGSCTGGRKGLCGRGRDGINFAAPVAVEEAFEEDVEKNMVKKMTAPTKQIINGPLRVGGDRG